MTDEYITKDNAIEAALYATDLTRSQIADIAEYIRLVKAEDVKPVIRGEWIIKDGFYTCSHCGKVAPCHSEGDYIAYWPDLSYCSSCGAIMNICKTEDT